MAIFNTVYGGEWKWKPWANTIAYYPLTSTSTTSDMSWNWYTLSKSWSGNTAFWNYWWISCLYIEKSATYYSAITTVSASGGLTMNIWYYSLNTPQYDNAGIIWTNNTNPVTTNDNRCVSIIHANGRPNNKYWIVWYVDDSLNTTTTTTTYNITNWSWHNLCFTFVGTTWILYVDWVQIWTLTKTMWYDQQNYLCISKKTKDYDRSIRWYVSNAIFESKTRTVQEVSDYYNKTKSNYWL